METNSSENIAVDGAVPSGNIIVEGVAGDEVRLVSSYEVPFANANGKTVTPEACRAFGRASARVLRAFLEE